MFKTFTIDTQIAYGQDALDHLLSVDMKKVTIVTDDSMVKFGLARPIEELLQKRQIPYQVFSGVQPDPSLDIVLEAFYGVLDYKPDTLIALGGGSSIDTAKAILYFDLQLQKKILGDGATHKKTLIAVPTTSGTGSEVTSYSVITDKVNNVKIPLMDQAMIPDIAILDPACTKTLPKSVIADSGMDVLTHAIEAYVSKDHNPISDAFALEAVRLVRDHLYAMYTDVSVFDHRKQMHLASCLAGLAFEKSSLGLNHGLAHSVGAHFHLPHGRCNAILLPYVVGFNSGFLGFTTQDVKTLKRYGDLAELFGYTEGTLQDRVRGLITSIEDLNKKMNIPRSFKEAGIEKEAYEASIKDLTIASLKDQCTGGNPVKVSPGDVIKLYLKVYN